MRMLDFLRRKKEAIKKYSNYIRKTLSKVATKDKKDKKDEESEEDRIRTKLMSGTYDKDYLFYANHDKTVEIIKRFNPENWYDFWKWIIWWFTINRTKNI